MEKIVLLLDSDSKDFTRLDSSVLHSDKISVIETLLEISEDMLGTDRTVIVLDGFITAGSIPHLRLFKELENLSYLFMIGCAEKRVMVEGLGRVFLCDTSMIDYTVLQSCYYGDESAVAKPVNRSGAYAAKVLAVGQHGMEAMLAEDYLHSIEREQELQKRIQGLTDQLGDLQQRCRQLIEENRRWENGCRQLLDRAFLLNNALQKYETVLTKDLYVKTNVKDYADRPAIIYFKVFTEFAGIHTFLEVLVDVFRKQERKNVKVVQLFDSSGERKIRLLPSYYRRIRNNFVPQEVTMANYMCKSGECSNLIARLLMNKAESDILIIVDNKDYDDMVLSGTFLMYQLCHSSDQALRLGLKPNTTIINGGNRTWLTWNPVCEKGLSEKERFIKLSSRPVIKHVLESSRNYANFT